MATQGLSDELGQRNTQRGLNNNLFSSLLGGQESGKGGKSPRGGSQGSPQSNSDIESQYNSGDYIGGGGGGQSSSNGQGGRANAGGALQLSDSLQRVNANYDATQAKYEEMYGKGTHPPRQPSNANLVRSQTHGYITPEELAALDRQAYASNPYVQGHVRTAYQNGYVSDVNNLLQGLMQGDVSRDYINQLQYGNASSALNRQNYSSLDDALRASPGTVPGYSQGRTLTNEDMRYQ